MIDNKNELKKSAVNKTINILENYGLKYRQSDFENEVNRVNITCGSVAVELSYLYGGSRGKSLKSIIKKLKRNENVSVFGKYIVFCFDITDLKNDKGSSDNLDIDVDENVREEQNSDEKNKNNINKLSNNRAEIKASDMAVIENILRKYNITFADLAKIMSRNDAVKRERIFIRFTEEEAQSVDIKAKNKVMNRSAFCKYACYKVMKEYESMKKKDLENIQGEYAAGNRTKRVCVTIFENDQIMIREFADKLSLPFSAFIRYCMLKV